ncbi:nickel/cobalt transporter [Roseivivax sp. CAU 1761]
MRRRLLILPLLVAAAALWALAGGQDAELARWAAERQRGFQNALAGGLRALRAGEPGALAALLGLCFAYGFFHALGPGHGKFLIGGYGMSRAVPLLRLSAISLLAALGQAATAILLVLAGLYVLGWSRAQLTGAAEEIMLPLSALAIGLIGGWLALRGGRRLLALRRPAPATACCGHRHGPSPEEIRQAAGPAETLALIAGIAIRPCSGAILLLVLTWHMQILGAGMLGAVAMALGTGSLTVLVASGSVALRRGTLFTLGGMAGAAYALPALELLAGGAIVALALEMAALV